MADYPYVMTSEKFREFMLRIRTVGNPSAVNKQFLTTLGYKSSNHLRFPRVLKFVNFVDSNSRPTEAWTSWKDTGNGPLVLGRQIRQAYAPLYQLYPKAQEIDNEALHNFFAPASGLGDKAVGAMIDTFKVLCALAAFDDSGTPSIAIEEHATPGDPGAAAVPTPRIGSVPALHIDVQVHIDSSASAEQIDQVFASMARHLYSKSSGE